MFPINADQHVRGPRFVEGSAIRVIPDAPAWSQQSPITRAPREVLDRAGNTFERALNVAALTEPCRVVLGRDRIGAQLLNFWNYGTSLLVAVSWCRGPIDAIESVTIDDKVLPGNVIATHYLGAQTSADPKLVTALAALGVAHTDAFTGISYSVFEFQVGADVGAIHAIIRGIKPYDSRDGAQSLANPATYVYSNTASLPLAAVITNSVWGLGAAFDWAGSVAAHDACDALVSGEKKHLIGLTLDRRLKASEWIEIIREHAGCFVVREGPAFRLVPDAPAASVMTFSKANKNIVGRSFRWRRLGLDEQPNVVSVSYTDTTAIPWRTAEVTVPANGLPPAGQELRLSRINMPGCQRHSQAVRIGTERRSYGRLAGVEFSWDARGTAARLRPGDVVTMNDGALFAGRDMRLTGVGLRGKHETTLTARLYDPNIYSSSADAAPSYPVSTLPSASNPPGIAGLNRSELSETPTTSRIAITWNAITTWPFLLTGAPYRVLVYDEDRLVFTDTPAVAGVTTPPLPVGRRYQIRVSARSSVAEGAQTPTFITLTGVSSEIPGEMLFAEFDIRPATGFDVSSNGSPAFRRGLHDALEGRVYRYDGANLLSPIEPYLWKEIPDAAPGGTSASPISAATLPIDNYIHWAQGSAPLPPEATGYEPPVVPGALLLWRSLVINVFGVSPRVARYVADLTVRDTLTTDFEPPEIRIKELIFDNEVANNGSMFGQQVSVRVYTPAGSFAKSYAEIGWPGKLRVYVATVREALQPTEAITSLTTGPTVVTMKRVYDKLRFTPQVTVLGTTPRQISVTNIVYGATTTTFEVRITNESNALVAEQFTYTAEGVEKL